MGKGLKHVLFLSFLYNLNAIFIILFKEFQATAAIPKSIDKHIQVDEVEALMRNASLNVKVRNAVCKLVF